MLTCALANSGSKTKAASKSGIASSHLNHIKKEIKKKRKITQVVVFFSRSFLNLKDQYQSKQSICYFQGYVS